LYSAATISELRTVLNRPKFAGLLSDLRVEELIDAIVDRGDSVEVTADVHECRDPKDNMVLAMAWSGAATHLLTGDNDLLSMHPWRGIAILNPQQYLEL
jgi:putative PIN family toxin of toxin-antitoxin system